ncbi:Protein kinase superfamily protein [Prunus dulcis]|uniref:Protein kinase superfamily protein n=1 Tax=Prunus dulcis TaxID=3755 RepID=A0A5H2Y302_PRUDU|nr:Protein kinase superfamily protein [Prunus dulcis]
MRNQPSLLSRGKLAAAFQSSLAPPQGTTVHGTGGVRTAIESSSFADRSPARRRSVLAGNCERTTGTHRNFKAADLPPPSTISVDPGIRDQSDLQKRPTGGLASSDQECEFWD